MRTWTKTAAGMLLLAWSLVTSQCVICPGMQQTAPSAPHDCCRPATNDHCNTEQSPESCAGHSAAFDSSPKIGAVPPTVIAGALMPVLFLEAAAPALPFPVSGQSHHPPPDRCLLNSVLLI